MTESTPRPSEANTSPDVAKKKKGCLFQLLIVLAVLLVLGLATRWWLLHKHRIEVVELTVPEEQVLEEKVVMLSGGTTEATTGSQERPDLPEGAVEFTEREVNGVLSGNEALRERVYIDLHKGKIEVKVNIDVPEDFPIMAGKTVRANVFLKVELQEEHLELRIQKFTVSGFAVPSDWIGGLKDVDLMDEFMGDSDFAKAFARGLKSLEVGEDYIRVVPNE